MKNTITLKKLELNNWEKYIINKYKKVYKLLLEEDFDSVDKIEMQLKKYIIKESATIENSKIVEDLLMTMAIIQREKIYLTASQAKTNLVA